MMIYRVLVNNELEFETENEQEARVRVTQLLEKYGTEFAIKIQKVPAILSQLPNAISQ
jgi:uncharacterized protein YjbK